MQGMRNGNAAQAASVRSAANGDQAGGAGKRQAAEAVLARRSISRRDGSIATGTEHASETCCGGVATPGKRWSAAGSWPARDPGPDRRRRLAECLDGWCWSPGSVAAWAVDDC